MKKFFAPINFARRLIQIGFFVLLPGLFIDLLVSIKIITKVIIDGTYSFNTYGYETILILAIIPVTMIFGRFFCGFMCSFGSMGDFLGFISRTLKIPKIKIGEITEKILKSIKYVLLVGIVALVWVTDTISVPNEANPWNIFGQYATIGGWPAISNFVSIGGLLLILIMIGSLFIQRLFCRYFCPLGGIFAIVSKFRFIKIEKPTSGCYKCKACTKNCPMAIQMYKYEEIKSGECIDCLKCVDICPKNNASGNFSRKKYSILIIGVLAIGIMTGSFFAGNAWLKSNQSNNTPTSTSTTDSNINTDNSNLVNQANGTLNTGKFTDGIYNGTGRGYRGTTAVTVTVTGGNITNISIDSNQDDDSYFARVESSIISKIIAAQDVNVDAVSGATYSSNSIMEAVADALGVAY